MTTVSRRSFLATLGAGLATAPGLLRAESRSARYPIAFSTLGCPAWSWKTILQNADKYGYAAIELRGVAAKEQPADTFAKIGKWTRHTHLKDSKPAGAERRYVLLGAGEVPVKEQVRVLAAAGYKGLYCFEWEKKWHPEIEEPEVAFPHYAKTMAEYLSAAGVKAS
jgi:sugar phosphate isomerase/epimerase